MATVAAIPATTSIHSETCRAAITKYWPKDLQATAITILTHENHSESPTRIGINQDPQHSRDYGCMQLNNYWHADWFTNHDWSDPEQNITEALNIYRTQGITAWYGVEGILW